MDKRNDDKKKKPNMFSLLMGIHKNDYQQSHNSLVSSNGLLSNNLNSSTASMDMNQVPSKESRIGNNMDSLKRRNTHNPALKIERTPNNNIFSKLSLRGLNDKQQQKTTSTLSQTSSASTRSTLLTGATISTASSASTQITTNALRHADSELSSVNNSRILDKDQDEMIIDHKAARRMSKQIDKQIEQDFKNKVAIESKMIKVAILGSGDSGKSTLIRQMRLLNRLLFTDDEKFSAIVHIHGNIVTAVHSMLSITSKLIEVEFQEENHANEFLKLSRDFGVGKDYIPSKLKDLIIFIWNSSEIQELFKDKAVRYRLKDTSY